MLPSRLLAQYRAAEKDPELTSLRGELALVDARLADLLTRVDSGESGAIWQALLKVHGAFKRGRATGTVEGMRQALAAIEVRLEAGVADHQAWREIQELIETRRKLADSETRRLVTLQQMLSIEQLMTLLGAVVDIIARHVPDKQALSAIALDLQRLGHIRGQGDGLPDGRDGEPPASGEREP